MSEIVMAKKADIDSHVSDKNNPHQVTKEQLGIQNVINSGGGVLEISAGPINKRPIHGTFGRIYFAANTAQIFFDDGGKWVEMGRDPKRIGVGDLGFEPSTKDEEQRISTQKVAELEQALTDTKDQMKVVRDEGRLLLDHSVGLAKRVTDLEVPAGGVETLKP